MVFDQISLEDAGLEPEVAVKKVYPPHQDPKKLAPHLQPFPVQKILAKKAQAGAIQALNQRFNTENGRQWRSGPEAGQLQTRYSVELSRIMERGGK